MVFKILHVFLLLVQIKEVIGSRYDEERLEHAGDELDQYDFNQKDDEEEPDPVTIKRYASQVAVTTLSPQEILEVRGAIQEMLSGHQNFLTPISSNEKNDKRSIQRAPLMSQNLEAAYDNYPLNIRTEYTDLIEETDTKSHRQFTNNDKLITANTLKLNTLELATDEDYRTGTTNNVIGGTQNKFPMRSFSAVDLRSNDMTTPLDADSTSLRQIVVQGIGEVAADFIDLKPAQDKSANFTTKIIKTTEKTVVVEVIKTIEKFHNTKKGITTTEASSTEKNTSRTKSTTTIKTPEAANPVPLTALEPTTTTKLQVDVPALLENIANLTYDYEMNLTDNLKKTLEKLSMSIREPPNAKGPSIKKVSGNIIAKCFVCGLQEEGVPRQAQCSDAFAGDFLLLGPVDVTARSKKAYHRKYCRYRNINNFKREPSWPGSVFGRWTGGCSVRWLDISGVYTQRTCRNRRQAILGQHYASKRMAMLEMSLRRIDDGCISSPMASLVPLARGISLFARFHVCVCTGSWCNGARPRARRGARRGARLALVVALLLVR